MVAVIESISNERGLSKDQLFLAIEMALAASAQTGSNRDRKLRVHIDRETGKFTCFRCWEVVPDEDLVSEERELPLSKASQQYTDIEVGDVVETAIDSPIVYGRIAAQIAKKVIQKKLREAEGKQIVANYVDSIGEIVRGTVMYVEPSGMTINLGNNATVLIPSHSMISTDLFRIGDRAQCALSGVREEGRPPFLIGTRTSNNFLEKLFTVEVPEIHQGHIRIIDSAREPGIRAKLAVQSLDPKLDPIGSCVGIRGSRVQAVSNELSGERIDVVLWNENIAQFVINAMAPADVQSIVMDEDTNTIDVIVSPDKLSQAIGKEGLNVRLASDLTKCRLNVMDADEAENKSISETNQLIEMFHSKLGVSEDIAKILVDEGIRTIEEIGYSEVDKLAEIEEFDRDLAEEIHVRANDIILREVVSAKPASAPSLTEIGVDEDVIEKLNANGIDSTDKFADLSVLDLLDIIPELDEERARRWILQAREPILSEPQASNRSQETRE